MVDLLVKKLTADDFEAEKYVQGVSSSSVGGLELQQQRHKIQQLDKETNSLLKKNVYNNYMQFIETAKEISYLESEMYQLSHLITEQKSLLSNMLELSVSGERGPGCGGGVVDGSNEAKDPVIVKANEEKNNRKKLTALLEQVEGCSHILEDKQRLLIHEGGLVELSQDDYSGQQRVRACLLNDSFMLASWIADRRGPVRYKFETLHLLDSLVAVNIKDRGQATNAFKLLIFPDARVFQAPSAQAKVQWLEFIEKAKHARVAQQQQQQDIDSSATTNEEKTDRSVVKQLSSESYTSEDDVSNPFGHWGMRAENNQSSQSPQPPNWVQELPEDLDQLIAQRKFEESLKLIFKGREYFENAAKTSLTVELKKSLETRVTSLESNIQLELKQAETRSHNAGPKVAQRAAHILIELKRHQVACDLFLQYRTNILRKALQNIRLEGHTSTYVRHLCSVFFKHLSDAVKEFTKVFSSVSATCVPALVVWANSSLSAFASRFSQHVFSSQSPLTTVSECVSIASHYCNEISASGIDLRCVLISSISRDLERRILSSRDKMTDAIKLRTQDENWEPTKFKDSKQMLAFIEEMNDMGVGGLKDYCTDESEIALTGSMIELVRAYVCYCEDILRIVGVWQDAAHMLSECVSAVLLCQLTHTHSALTHHMLQDKSHTIRLNGLFMLDVLIPLTQQRFTEMTAASHPTFAELLTFRRDFSKDTYL